MFTSGIKNDRQKATLTAFAFTAGAVLTAILSFIYELFSHQVYSGFMLYAFLIPFLGGGLVYGVMSGIDRAYPGRVAYNAYNSGLVTLTVGSLFKGALEIYGTDNKLTIVFWLAGGLLVIAGIVWFIIETIVKNDKKKTPQK